LALEKLENLRDGFGVRDEKEVPFAPMIPVLAALLRTIESQENKADCYKKLDKWYWSSVFTSAYSAAADSQMTTDFKEMREWFKDDSKTPKTVIDMEDDLANLHLIEIETRSNSKYKGVMSLIALEGAKDFDTCQTLENARSNDLDHIFPQSEKHSFSSAKYINSVLNMTWMSKETNVRKSGKKPSVYIEDFVSEKYAGKEDRFIEILKTHLICGEAFHAMRADDLGSFLANREHTIISKIGQHLGIEDLKHKPTLISPKTPFTNKKIFWDTLRLCEGHILWVDKYFSQAGLEIIAEASLNSDKTKEIRILMSADKVDNSFRKLFKALRDELGNKGISCELRVIMDSKTKGEIHDRWIIAENAVFNVTSPDVMARGQYSEIKQTTNKPPFGEWWSSSKDIIRDWDQIEKNLVKS
jgi:hypothetical protein